MFLVRTITWWHIPFSTHHGFIKWSSTSGGPGLQTMNASRCRTFALRSSISFQDPHLIHLIVQFLSLLRDRRTGWGHIHRLQLTIFFRDLKVHIFTDPQWMNRWWKHNVVLQSFLETSQHATAMVVQLTYNATHHPGHQLKNWQLKTKRLQCATNIFV